MSYPYAGREELTDGDWEEAWAAFHCRNKEIDMENIKEFWLTPIRAGHMGATDLRAEAFAALGADQPMECYSAMHPHWAEAGWVLFLPEARRAGVAWGADAFWTDAESAEEAVWRFLNGEMVE